MLITLVFYNVSSLKVEGQFSLSTYAIRSMSLVHVIETYLFTLSIWAISNEVDVYPHYCFIQKFPVLKLTSKM